MEKTDRYVLMIKFVRANIAKNNSMNGKREINQVSEVRKQ